MKPYCLSAAVSAICLSLVLQAQTIVVDTSVETGPVKTLNGVNGGPALIGKHETATRFVEAMAKRDVPLDFLSWHWYGLYPDVLPEHCKFYRQLLDEDKYDFGNFPYEMNADSTGTEITVKFDRRAFAYIELR